MPAAPESDVVRAKLRRKKAAEKRDAREQRELLSMREAAREVAAPVVAYKTRPWLNRASLRPADRVLRQHNPALEAQTEKLLRSKAGDVVYIPKGQESPFAANRGARGPLVLDATRLQQLETIMRRADPKYVPTGEADVALSRGKKHILHYPKTVGQHPAIMAHELGHATKGPVGRALNTRPARLLRLLEGFPVGLGAVVAGKRLIEHSDMSNEQKAKWMGGTTAAAALPSGIVVAEEARASLVGRRLMKKYLGKASGAKPMLGALGSYVTAGFAPILGVGLYHTATLKRRAKQDKLKALYRKTPKYISRTRHPITGVYVYKYRKK